MDKMSLKQILDFTIGAFCYLFAVSMFFYFPAVEAWTLIRVGSALFSPSAWISALLVLLVVIPAVVSPVVLVSRSHDYARPVLAAACLSLGALFLTAGFEAPLLYGRVALISLLSGQLLALGLRSRDSVPFNWMVYLAFILANMNYPDAGILSAANLAAGCYLLFAGSALVTGHWEISEKKKGGYRVMVG